MRGPRARESEQGDDMLADELLLRSVVRLGEAARGGGDVCKVLSLPREHVSALFALHDMQSHLKAAAEAARSHGKVRMLGEMQRTSVGCSQCV